MNFESVLCYPGICLLEGTNMSEGRGTAAPFRVVGADYIDAEQLSEALNQEKLPGVITTPVWFIPSTSKFAGVNCAGVVFHVTDSKVFRPVTLGITLLDTVRKLYGDKFQILPPYAGTAVRRWRVTGRLGQRQTSGILRGRQRPVCPEETEIPFI